MTKLLFALIILQSFFPTIGGIASLGNVGFHSTEKPTVSIILLHVVWICGMIISSSHVHVIQIQRGIF